MGTRWPRKDETETLCKYLSHLPIWTHRVDSWTAVPPGEYHPSCRWENQTQNSPLGLTTSYLASYLSIHNIIFTSIHTESGIVMIEGAQEKTMYHGSLQTWISYCACRVFSLLDLGRVRSIHASQRSTIFLKKPTIQIPGCSLSSWRWSWGDVAKLMGCCSLLPVFTSVSQLSPFLKGSYLQ